MSDAATLRRTPKIAAECFSCCARNARRNRDLSTRKRFAPAGFALTARSDCDEVVVRLPVYELVHRIDARFRWHFVDDQGDPRRSRPQAPRRKRKRVAARIDDADRDDVTQGNSEPGPRLVRVHLLQNE